MRRWTSCRSRKPHTESLRLFLRLLYVSQFYLRRASSSFIRCSFIAQLLEFNLANPNSTPRLPSLDGRRGALLRKLNLPAQPRHGGNPGAFSG